MQHFLGQKQAGIYGNIYIIFNYMLRSPKALSTKY